MFELFIWVSQEQTKLRWTWVSWGNYKGWKWKAIVNQVSSLVFFLKTRWKTHKITHIVIVKSKNASKSEFTLRVTKDSWSLGMVTIHGRKVQKEKIEVKDGASSPSPFTTEFPYNIAHWITCLWNQVNANLWSD